MDSFTVEYGPTCILYEKAVIVRKYRIILSIIVVRISYFFTLNGRNRLTECWRITHRHPPPVNIFTNILTKTANAYNKYVPNFLQLSSNPNLDNHNGYSG